MESLGCRKSGSQRGAALQAPPLPSAGPRDAGMPMAMALLGQSLLGRQRSTQSRLRSWLRVAPEPTVP